MKRYETWGWIAVVAAVIVLLAAGSHIFVIFLGLDSSQNQAIAAWVQAVGSILAIVAAALIAVHQGNVARKLAEQLEAERLRRRWSSVKAVVDALFQQCLDVAVEFEDDGTDNFGPLSFALTYNSTSFTQAIQRVEAIPLFDLDSDTLVTAVTGFKDAAERLQKWADAGQKRSHPWRKAEGEDEPADWQIREMGRQRMDTVTQFYGMVQSVTGGRLLKAALMPWERDH